MFQDEKPIQKDKLHEQVFNRLCTLLREGQFTPGEAVPVARVSQAFGVSAMPVREALTRLHAVGVLATVSGRSVGVPLLSQADLLDLRKVRMEVEAAAVIWAVENSDEAFLSELDSIFQKLVDAENSGDVGGFIKCNYEFHFRYYQQSKSPVLIDIINTLWLRVSPHLHLYHLSRTDRFHMSNVHHRTMIEAARSADPAAASEALVADLTDAYDGLMAAQAKVGRAS